MLARGLGGFYHGLYLRQLIVAEMTFNLMRAIKHLDLGHLAFTQIICHL
jgi:hypothetical protein